MRSVDTAAEISETSATGGKGETALAVALLALRGVWVLLMVPYFLFLALVGVGSSFVITPLGGAFLVLVGWALWAWVSKKLGTLD